MKSVLFLFAVSLLVIMTGTANAYLINGGFETGDLAGWQIAGDASVQTSSFGSGPTQGTYQAVLTNDWLAYSAGAVNPGLGYVYPLSGSPGVWLDDSYFGLPHGSMGAITQAPQIGNDMTILSYASAIKQTLVHSYLS
jgi:hypothetical protein